MNHSIGFDLGGTTMTVALIDSHGKVLFSDEKETLVSQGKETLSKRIIEMLKTAIGKSDNVKSIGMGLPGLIDVNNGVVITSPNFPDWKEFPIVKIINQSIDLPVCIDNDVRVATIGEHLFGAGKNCKDLMCLTVGTGIGSGLMLDGNIYYGNSLTAGEFGHMTMVAQGGKLCGCGNTGCLETLANASAIVDLADRMYSRHPSNIFLELKQDQKTTPKLVAEAAKAGCQTSIEVWNHIGTWLGIALANIVNLLNPEKVIIGGGVAECGELLLSPIRKTILTRAFEKPAKQVTVVKAELGPQAGIIGASKLFEVRSK